MLERRIPEWLRHAPAPSVRGFAALSGIEAIARGILISVFPLVMYRALGDAKLVSETYFIIGIMSLFGGLMVPLLNALIPRRWLYCFGAGLFALGSFLAILGGYFVVVALLLITLGTVTMFVCFNAYVLDYIARIELGKCETSRMFYSAVGWTFGPVLGVFLMKWWPPAPFLIAGSAALCLMALFLFMRLGNGKLVAKARRAAPNPIRFLPRFLAQKRLVAGYLIAVIRSAGWWIYVVYLPIFAVQNGLGETVGGAALSVSNGLLFLTPLLLKFIERATVRRAIRIGFLLSACLFALATVAAGLPWLVVGLLVAATGFLILLDICAGLPFLMAVHPHERTEMSAIYSSFRDISAVITPGAAWLALLVGPFTGIFAMGAAVLLGGWVLAGTLHPRLGRDRKPKGVA